MKNIKNRIFNILLLLLIFFVLSGIWIAYRCNKILIEKEARVLALKKVQLNLVEVEQKLLRKELKRLISDAFIIKDIAEDELSRNHLYHIESRFLTVLKNKRIYDQIRYIDENGNELIRIDLEDSKPVSYKGDKLQNKADRYYFKETMATENGQVYVSKMDLNIEHGKLELPIKPTIRIATKIYDTSGKERGIIITNYYAKVMINDFIDVAVNSEGEAYLLNAKSYWLSNKKNPETQFAFMYDGKESVTFKNKYPDAYKAIFENGKEFFESDTGFFFAKKLIPFKDIEGDDFVIPVKQIVLGDGNLMIVLHIEKSKISKIFFGSVSSRIKYILHTDVEIFFILLSLSFLLSTSIILYNDHKKSLKFYAEVDQGTEVFNRHAGLKKMENLIAMTRLTKINIAIIFIDVNGLKVVNDMLGHQCGDKLIKSVAEIIKSTKRSKDILFRYGGDEFIMCMENLDYDGTHIIWNRIMSKIEQENETSKEKYNISLSHGVSIISGDDPNVNIDEYIEEADQRMYEEKKEVKKNAVIIKT